ncbi:MAG TPA: Nif3-like dinuclear metal center hexameric protein [Firmicutes bacterium]|nr:Nif3-like dinuclear metal center hexameric protein [Bacillota bacterium]
MKHIELAAYLNGYLRVEEIPDTCVNGLEVEAPGDVHKVALAVDASLDNFRMAREAGADFVLVHHGMFWDKVPITGVVYRRVSFLISNGMALYAAHLPLDMHPEIGNNVGLAKIIGLTRSRPFGSYHGLVISLMGEVEPTPLECLVGRIEAGLGRKAHVVAAGPRTVTKVAICSGRAPDLFAEAVKAGADVFFTGETSHQLVGEAQDAGVNVIFGGHWATETLGVKAAGAHIEERFGLPTVFVGQDTGF